MLAAIFGVSGSTVNRIVQEHTGLPTPGELENIERIVRKHIDKRPPRDRCALIDQVEIHYRVV